MDDNMKVKMITALSTAIGRLSDISIYNENLTDETKSSLSNTLNNISDKLDEIVNSIEVK